MEVGAAVPVGVVVGVAVDGSLGVAVVLVGSSCIGHCQSTVVWSTTNVTRGSTAHTTSRRQYRHVTTLIPDLYRMGVDILARGVYGGRKC